MSFLLLQKAGFSNFWASRLLVRRAASSAHKFVNNGMFDKILIANRGEIACRVMRTAKRLGVRTVAVFSDADSKSMHTQLADEAYNIGPAAAKESYLVGQRIIDVAKRSGAQAIHPGYGFLSENADFAELCEKNNVVFIGPPSSAIRSMGSKSASKDIMRSASVPIIPGYHGKEQSIEALTAEAQKIGFPVLIKAVLGGGGKGMRIVERIDDLEEAVTGAQREALASFGDSHVLIEKYLRRPKHIEIQVFADRYRNCVSLFERDCSLQRRYQKVLEESPGPGITPEQRKIMGDAAVAAALAVDYVGAGTVEFIVDEDNTFYFMEMNTRLQVEHPVTEMVTKQDLVEWQLKVAAGHPLPLAQDELSLHGHAIEARIYAENPNNNFLPGTGRLLYLSTPEPSQHVRVETGVRQGDEVSVYYDPMIAKLVVWDVDRFSALRRLRTSLDNFNVAGLTTNIEFLRKCAAHPAYIAGQTETSFIPKYKAELIAPTTQTSDYGLALASLAFLLNETSEQKISAAQSEDPTSPWSVMYGRRINEPSVRHMRFLDNEQPIEIFATALPKENSYTVKINGKEMQVSGTLKGNGEMRAIVDDRLVSCTFALNKDLLSVFTQDGNYHLKLPFSHYSTSAAEKGSLFAPMPGKIIKVLIKAGDKVKEGAPLLIMEAMKMEHTIRAPKAGVVQVVHCALGDLVEPSKSLIAIESA